MQQLAPQPSGIEEIIESFDIDELRPFKPDYLANWLAETYNIKMSDAALEARVSVLEKTREKIRQTNSDGMHDFRLDSSGLNIQSYKLILVPIWILRYRIDGEEFPATVNGQTSLVTGEFPATGIRKFANWLFGKG